MHLCAASHHCLVSQCHSLSRDQSSGCDAICVVQAGSPINFAATKHSIRDAAIRQNKDRRSAPEFAYYQLPLLITHDRSLELVWVAHTGHHAKGKQATLVARRAGERPTWRRETSRPSTRSLPNTSKLQPHGAITIRERCRQHRTPERPPNRRKSSSDSFHGWFLSVSLTLVCSGTNHAGLHYNMFWQPRPMRCGAVDPPRGDKLNTQRISVRPVKRREGVHWCGRRALHGRPVLFCPSLPLGCLPAEAGPGVFMGIH
jgi:hypothetical protein